MRSQSKGQNNFFSSGPIGLVLLGALSVVAAGCGWGGGVEHPAVYPANGKVTFNGKTPEGACVTLHPKSPTAMPDGRQLTPSGRVNPDGTFALSSYLANDGAPPGEYSVTVEWRKTQGSDESRVLGPNLLPPKYSKVETSPLEVVIAAGPNELKQIVLK
jgi:hypothetical protein